MEKTIFLLFLGFGMALNAQSLQVADLFGNNMVLQQGRENPIWGITKPMDTVTIMCNSEIRTCVSDQQGNWQLRLPILPQGKEYIIEINTNNEQRIFSHVAVGEIWLASGQSNMLWQIGAGITNLEETLKDANYPDIRYFRVESGVSEKPEKFLEPSKSDNHWGKCDNDSLRYLSAVAYLFAKKIHLEQNVPVGIITSVMGGTCIEAWTSRDMLSTNLKIRSEFKKLDAENLHWKEEQKKNKSERQFQNLPSALFNAMINPIIPFGIRGVIWYQGEQNVGATDYHDFFSYLINDWRIRWGIGYFPFLYVQLANLEQGAEGDENLPILRESQLKCSSIPNTGMVTTIDIGDPNDVHPRNKLDVGNRLYLWAKKLVYGAGYLVSSGPVFESYELIKNKVLINFSSVGDGLLLKEDKAGSGFEIAGTDGEFYPATVIIIEDKLEVQSVSVAAPKTVRYAWRSNPPATLYNKNGLPASPFRTDYWKVKQLR